ncbi:hypothetical protein CVT24_010471 [Panaeolus cyanescens]|uniref:G domain-containing protein n=1 Tax=Panaeolus cyanescens TaxID=181874 RepID=A0A409YVU2_9AGAR|nr:hypothetical protein CVT24_010471 [Panaeolus cyanescens]
MDNDPEAHDDYVNLKFLGPISVERHVKPLPVLMNSNYILLIGLTGAGKSNFLEALSGRKDLKISGDSLESVTQEVTVYKLVNVQFKVFGEPIFLIDCPGFCDTKTSEFKMIKLLQKWTHPLQGKHLGIQTSRTIDTIFYFHRITDKRLSSTQKDTLRLIKAMVGDQHRMETQLVVVTTMWDTLWRPDQIQEAEKRFAQLRESLNEILGTATEHTLRFENTQKSALRVIDQAEETSTPYGIRGNMRRGINSPPFRMFYREKMGKAPFAMQLLQFLNTRIGTLTETIRMLDNDIRGIELDDESNKSERDELVGMRKTAEEALRVVMDEQMELLALQERAQARPNFARRVIGYMHNKLS